jgi:signal transduction histidine kinase
MGLAGRHVAAPTRAADRSPTVAHVEGGERRGGHGPPGPRSDWRGPAGQGAQWQGPPWWRPDEPSRHRRGPGAFLPLLIGGIQVIGANIASSDGLAQAQVDGLTYTLLVIGPVGLLLRRRWPLLAYAITLACTVAIMVVGDPAGPFFLAALVGLFGAERRASRWPVWLMTAVAYVVFAVAILPPGGVGRAIFGYQFNQATVGTYIVVAVWTAVALALAGANKVRGEYFAEMARTQAEAAKAKQEQSRRQASDERLRIARELHDVLGHHLSLINVRAGVGLHLLDTQPEQAREALDAIKVASAEALREVRGVLAALNAQDESAPRQPAPGLAEIDRLADDARSAGLVVTVLRSGDGEVPGEMSRAAFRIVQEGLTNVRRHAGPGASVTVELSSTPDALTVLVDDTGTGPMSSTSDGNGIPGMRERALALGGTLDAGPRPGGGFRVQARLPIAGARGGVDAGGPEEGVG